MLVMTIEPFSVFDEETCSFIESKKPVKLQMEHSLLSISKWEQKIHRPLLEAFKEKAKKPVTAKEFLFYCQCMTINDVPDNVFYGLTEANLREILEYINDPMTATWFSDDNSGSKEHKILTNERIYGYMVGLQIPFSCEKWHINRLMTLITVCSNANNPKKMSKKDTVKKYADLNKQRRAAMNSKG